MRRPNVLQKKTAARDGLTGYKKEYILHIPWQARTGIFCLSETGTIMYRVLSFILLLTLTLTLSLSLAGCGSKPKKPVRPTDPEYIDAVELKLKFRELADQLLATMPNHTLVGFVGMPTSFVDQNNTSRSSPLGRLIAESMFYEFNQRGFPTREYRLTGNIRVTGARDNLTMYPNAKILSTQRWASILLGTYQVDRDVTFINARLVRVCDGLVQRTGQLVLANTPIIDRLTYHSGSDLYGSIGDYGTISIVQQR